MKDFAILYFCFYKNLKKYKRNITLEKTKLSNFKNEEIINNNEF